jgi:hypothetical protein
MTAQNKIEAATLASAMALAFGEIEAATKTNENAAFKAGGKASKYADLGAVIDAVKPALIAHGLFFVQMTHEAEGGVCIETVVHHSSGEALSCGRLFVPASKRDAHGFGSALSYARRYSLMTAFGVPTEDDDGNAAVKAGPEPKAENVIAITDAQRDMIQQIAAAVGKPLEDICKAYKVPSLKALNQSQAEAAIKRLQSLAPAKEPENA